MNRILQRVNTPLYIGSVLIAFFLGILARPIMTERDKKLKFYEETSIEKAYNIIHEKDSVIKEQQIKIEKLCTL